jgi:uncharacterized small protein (DUF1192 family)
MFEDEDLAAQHKVPKKKDLTPLSLAELDAYIADMESEILRVRSPCSNGRSFSLWRTLSLRERAG